MVTCPRCSAEARDGARFCGVCGQPLSTGGPAPAGKAAPRPTGKAIDPSPAPGTLPPPPPATPQGRGANRTTAMVAGGALLVSLLVLAAVLVSRSGSDGEAGVDADSDGGTETDAGDGGTDTDSSAGDESASTPAEPSESPSTTPPAPVEILTPSSVSASNTRTSVELRCGGTADYGAQNLFDRDPNTGWGASADDGAGQSVTVDLGRQVHLTQVGITPGFTKVGAREDQGCAAVNAFPFNRFVAEVRWSFDAGPPVTQTFDRRGSLQRTRVDVDTRTVTMTILRTEYQGRDTDTVISSMELRGSR